MGSTMEIIGDRAVVGNIESSVLHHCVGKPTATVS